MNYWNEYNILKARAVELKSEIENYNSELEYMWKRLLMFGGSSPNLTMRTLTEAKLLCQAELELVQKEIRALEKRFQAVSDLVENLLDLFKN